MRLAGNSRIVSYLLVAGLAATTTGGCSSSIANLRLDSRSVAKRLGVANCRVTVPLAQSEVIDYERRWGDADVEKRPEWVRMVSVLEAGDELRMVSCPHYYFYAHIRSGVIVDKMYTMILD
jgi:hypothetical protein